MGRPDRDFTFSGAVFCTVLAFLTYFIAFVTPNWLESDPQYKSQFLRLGLWEACFDGYMHPEDYVSKAYYGCWYIYYPEFYYIRSWLNPPWYYAVQMLGIVAFISLIITLIILGCQACKVMDRDSKKHLRIATIAHFLATFCITVELILMGVQSKDRRWMPKPDHNRLGFSYGFACVAGFASLFAFGFLFVRSVTREEDELLLPQEEAKYREPYQDPRMQGAYQTGGYPQQGPGSVTGGFPVHSISRPMAGDSAV